MSDRTALMGCAVCVVCIVVEAIAAVAMATSTPRAAARASATSTVVCAQTHRANARAPRSQRRSRSQICCGRDTHEKSIRERTPHSRKQCRASGRDRTPGTNSSRLLSTYPGASGTTTGGTAGSTAPGGGGTGASSGGSASGTAGGSSAGAPGSGGAPSGSGEGTPEAPAQPSGPTHVQVTAEDTEGYRFILSRTTVPAGEVVIEFVNHGQDEHNLHAVESSSSTEEGSLPNTAPGGHPQLKLDLRPGTYTLFCSLPGHEAKGMKATLTVQ
jgi:plastocyanin